MEIKKIQLKLVLFYNCNSLIEFVPGCHFIIVSVILQV